MVPNFRIKQWKMFEKFLNQQNFVAQVKAHLDFVIRLDGHFDINLLGY